MSILAETDLEKGALAQFVDELKVNACVDVLTEWPLSRSYTDSKCLGAQRLRKLSQATAYPSIQGIMDCNSGYDVNAS